LEIGDLRGGEHASQRRGYTGGPDGLGIAAGKELRRLVRLGFARYTGQVGRQGG
jgi:hypothetical protein